MPAFLLVCLAVLGTGLWMYGRNKQSRMAVFIGGLGVAAPLLYFAGGRLLLPVAPLLALGAAYWTVNRARGESR